MNVRKLLAVLVILLFLIIGLFLIYGGVTKLMQGLQSQSWPSVQGTILSSNVGVLKAQIIEYCTLGGSGVCYLSPSSCPGTCRPSTRNVTSYYPNITFSYSVNGSSYTSRNVTILFSPNSSAEEANSTISKYPVGSKATVYYNPSNPVEGVLQNGANSSGLIVIFFGLIFILFAYLVIRGMIKTKPPQTQKGP